MPDHAPSRRMNSVGVVADIDDPPTKELAGDLEGRIML